MKSILQLQTTRQKKRQQIDVLSSTSSDDPDWRQQQQQKQQQQGQQGKCTAASAALKRRKLWSDIVIFLPVFVILLLCPHYYMKNITKVSREIFGIKIVDIGSSMDVNNGDNNYYYTIHVDDYEKAIHRLNRFEPLRGVRYLYEQHSLLLFVLPKVGNNDPVRIIGQFHNKQENISSVVDETNNHEFDCDNIPPLTIWVRLAGPEIVAGLATRKKIKSSEMTTMSTTATAFRSSFGVRKNRDEPKQCIWEYHNGQPLAPGNYTIDVKILAMNDDGRDVLSDEQCNFQKSHTIVGGTKLLEFSGAEEKYHYPDDACCDLCTKTPLCTHYISTNYYNESTKKAHGPHCILHSNTSRSTTKATQEEEQQWQPLQIIPSKKDNAKQQKYVVGTSRKDKKGATKFLGCGYSKTLEMNFCKDGGWDDVPYMVRNTFHVSSSATTSEQEEKQAASSHDPTTTNATSVSRRLQQEADLQLPICPSSLEGVSYGRWVQPSTTTSCKIDILSRDGFVQYKHNQSQPEGCWVRDKLVGNNCINGCKRNSQSNVWKSHLITDRKNVGKNDGNEFFDYTWQPYHCHLPLYTTDMLVDCFQKHDYAPELNGDSIMGYFLDYYDHRLHQIHQKLKKWGKKRIIFDNHHIVHHAWHDSNDQFNKTLNEWSANGARSERPREGMEIAKKLWISPPFVSSERETHVTQGRVETLRTMARKTLVDTGGWHEVDWVNISMALSYESSILYDGLHVVGSPMKTMFHMLMHSVCAED